MHVCQIEQLVERAGETAAEPLVGVVLAGGWSRRFGRDKTGLRIQGVNGAKGEQSLLLRAACVLERLLGDPARVFVSCRPVEGDADGQGLRIRREVAERGYGIVEDRFPGDGTLRAVYSALEQTRRACLVIPCDLPCMDKATLGELLAFREDKRRGGRNSLCTCFFDTVYGATQPLVAVYEAEALDLFRKAVAAGKYKLAAVVPPDLTDCLRYGEEKAFFFQNVNYPEDWERIRRDVKAL